MRPPNAEVLCAVQQGIAVSQLPIVRVRQWLWASLGSAEVQLPIPEKQSKTTKSQQLKQDRNAFGKRSLEVAIGDLRALCFNASLPSPSAWLPPPKVTC